MCGRPTPVWSLRLFPGQRNRLGSKRTNDGLFFETLGARSRRKLKSVANQDHGLAYVKGEGTDLHRDAVPPSYSPPALVCRSSKEAEEDEDENDPDHSENHDQQQRRRPPHAPSARVWQVSVRYRPSRRGPWPGTCSLWGQPQRSPRNRAGAAAWCSGRDWIRRQRRLGRRHS